MSEQDLIPNVAEVDETSGIPVLPLRDVVVYPHMVIPLFVGREKSINALEEAMSRDKEILLAAQKKAKTNDTTDEDIFDVGTIGTIIQLLRLPDGTVKVLVEGKRRARITQFIPNEDFFICATEPVEEVSSTNVEIEVTDRPDACMVSGHHNLLFCGDFARKFRLFAQLYKIRLADTGFEGPWPV